MTYREKLVMEHPECVGDHHPGGCAGCPSTYGYEPEEDTCEDRSSCTACWNREIPNTKHKFEYAHTGDPNAKTVSTRMFDDHLEATLELTGSKKKDPPKGMTSETFNKLLDELDGNSLETLKQKNAKYASPTDCLHNFDAGAEIMGRTPAQCAWGYMTKHLVALRDKVDKDDFSDRDDLLEKCQDIINYIRFIWLIGNETEARKEGDK